MSSNEKHPHTVDSKQADSTDVESANEFPAAELHGAGTLKRQLKNRHIAMIRCVLLSGL